jgi:cyclophilin family peptidyl-prolyl cis-trans isomerase
MASCSFSLRAVRLCILSFLVLAFTSAAVAAPNAPTNLRCAVTASNAFTLIWDDNSTDETNFDLVYNANGTGSNTFALGASPGTGTIGTSLLGISGTATFQIRATNGSGSSLSNIVNVTFAALGTPGNLLSKAQADGSMILMWTDNAFSEAGYFVETSTAVSGPFTFLGSLGANFTEIISTLAPSTTYFFRVRGFQGAAANPTAYSAYSSVASFTTPERFTSGTAPPIFFNQAFSYQAVVSTGSARTSWSITGLPTGLTFNSSTGAITGTPTVTGAFNCPMSATFANGWTASNTLQLRVIRAPGAPVSATTIGTQTLTAGGNVDVALGDKFADPDSESAVRIVTNIGTMDFILYNSATPLAVTNFLEYVNAGVNNYNGAVFHRAISGFVAQGGAFKVQSAPNNFSVTPTSPSPTNEPGISNLRGTVAMAKIGGNPNSATNQFFVNLGNNSSNLDRDSGSPNANGGFTAFARVAGNGMTVADAIGNLPSATYSVNLGGTSTSMDSWPLTSASAAMDTTKVVSITSAAPVAVLSYAVTGNTNSAVASATISDTNVQINALAGGQTNVTVTATDLDGGTVSQTFTVTVNQAPVITSSLPPAALANTPYNFSYTTTGFPAPTFNVTSGALPTGLSLSTAGVISGTPTAAGTFTGTVTASNGIGTAATQNFSITVNQAPEFTNGPPPGTGVFGTVYTSFAYTASGTPAPTFTVTSGALPTGLSLSTGGVITGTPAAAGTFTGTVTASNGIGTAATQNFSIVIAKAAATVSLGGLAQTFNNTPRSATATTTPAGLAVDYTYDGFSTAPTNAGSYTVVATINDSNYSGTASGTLAIAKATAGLVLNGLLQTYDGSPKAVSATTTPSGLTVSITYDGSATAPTNHGSYVIAASINDANYSGTASGTLTIRGQSAASWRTQHFSSTQTTAGWAADDVDPDGDGLKNLAEYALGTDPWVRNASPAPIADANGLTLTFTRPKDLPDVSYSAESTDSLGSWTPINLELVSDGPVQTWRARDPLASGNPNRRFIRLGFTAGGS